VIDDTDLNISLLKKTNRGLCHIIGSLPGAFPLISHCTRILDRVPR
jgi:hypothetical protein